VPNHVTAYKELSCDISILVGPWAVEKLVVLIRQSLDISLEREREREKEI
jgi:hypothetical protein